MPVFPPFQDDRGWVPVFWLGLAEVDGRLEGWEVSSRVLQSEDGGTSGQVDEWTGFLIVTVIELSYSFLDASAGAADPHHPR